MFDLAAFLTAAITLAGGIAYAVRLEGRVTAHDQLFDEREKTALLLHQELREDLKQIKDKLDQVLSGQTTR